MAATAVEQAAAAGDRQKITALFECVRGFDLDPWPHFETWRYPALRFVPGTQAQLFLTFDDGPDQESTPRVLDLLARRGISATFFLITEKARANPGIVQRFKNEGHAVGNHSLDHNYRAYFSSAQAMLTWILKADHELRSLGLEPIGFRPPAGVRTPELHAALAEIDMPLILWRRRFYDTVRRWTLARARRSLDVTRAGDIILLHDTQPACRIDEFLATLDFYIEQAMQRGFEFRALTAAQCRASERQAVQGIFGFPKREPQAVSERQQR